MKDGEQERVEATEAEVAALRESCTRFLHWHGARGPAELLAELLADIEPDRYGEGGVVAELEGAVAEVLGKPAAVFLPSGTMGQQIALRAHADRRGRRTVVFHPTCHLDHHELKGYERLHGLVGRPVGDEDQLLALSDLEAVAEPPAALLLELPQRDLGGQLPAWDELVAQCAWARDRGAATHMDGARLWGCEAFYDRSLAEIASGFDTVYVSFYKQLGGLTGCCVTGAADVVAEVREWRTRHGGTLFALWPYAASALAGMRLRLPRMGAYLERARGIAEALSGLDGVRVVPDPPHTPMLHLLLERDAGALRAAALRLAERQGVWTWPRFGPTGVPGVSRAELEVGDGTMGFEPGEVREVVAGLLRG